MISRKQHGEEQFWLHRDLWNQLRSTTCPHSHSTKINLILNTLPVKYDLPDDPAPPPHPLLYVEYSANELMATRRPQPTTYVHAKLMSERETVTQQNGSVFCRCTNLREMLNIERSHRINQILLISLAINPLSFLQYGEAPNTPPRLLPMDLGLQRSFRSGGICGFFPDPHYPPVASLAAAHAASISVHTACHSGMTTS